MLSDGGAELVRLLSGCQPQAAFVPSLARADNEPPLSLLMWHARRDVSLVHEGDTARAVYVVRSGSFKCIRTLEDGYEQVLSIAHPGDVLGFEALCTGHQPVGVVALEEASAFALPLPGLLELRQHHPSFDRALQLSLSRQLVRASRIAEMMAAVSSEVRLARFLLWLAERMGELGQSTRRLRLRLSRRDIASLLGVAHETVSRSFTAMADAGIIKVENREVELLDAERLHARARVTRCLIPDPPRADHHGPTLAAGLGGFPDRAAVLATHPAARHGVDPYRAWRDPSPCAQ
jgi:CRP/FNR family transcriptional regulator